MQVAYYIAEPTVLYKHIKFFCDGIIIEQLTDKIYFFLFFSLAAAVAAERRAVYRLSGTVLEGKCRVWSGCVDLGSVESCRAV